jgi:Carboxypeptidase regulatory-like domain
MPSKLTALQAAKVKEIDITGNFIIIPKNKAILDAYIPAKNECSEYAINFALLKTIIPKKDYDAIIGIISTNTDLKEVIAESVQEIAHTTIAYCTKENKTALAASFHISYWDVIKLKQEDVLPLVERISKALTPLLTDVKFMEYEITAPILAALMSNAVTYDNSIGSTGTSSNEASTANVNIDKLTKTMLGQIRQLRLLNARNKTLNPEFYTDLILNTRTQHAATRSTGIQGQVLNKLGQGIPNQQVNITGTNLSAFTDADGFYSFLKLTVGKYTLQTSNEGGDSDLHEVEVFYRHITTQDFSL